MSTASCNNTAAPPVACCCHILAATGVPLSSRQKQARHGYGDDPGGYAHVGEGVR